MDDPQVVSRDEWLAARRELLAEEKEFTRRRDALNIKRRKLPMVEIDKQDSVWGSRCVIGPSIGAKQASPAGAGADGSCVSARTPATGSGFVRPDGAIDRAALS